MKLIDKAAVVAELEDWRDKIKKGIFSIPLSGSDRAYATFEYEVLGKVIISLDALEVKEVDSNDAFIEKACEWLSQTDFCHYYNKEFINDFCKAMKE